MGYYCDLKKLRKIIKDPITGIEYYKDECYSYKILNLGNECSFFKKKFFNKRKEKKYCIDCRNFKYWSPEC